MRIVPKFDTKSTGFAAKPLLRHDRDSRAANSGKETFLWKQNCAEPRRSGGPTMTGRRRVHLKSRRNATAFLRDFRWTLRRPVIVGPPLRRGSAQFCFHKNVSLPELAARESRSCRNNGFAAKPVLFVSNLGTIRIHSVTHL